MPELPPIAEFAFPGPLRDQLVAAILSGKKTATTGLVAELEIDGDPIPRAGQRETVIDSAGDPVAIIELLRVDVLRLGDVGLDVAIAEGEDYDSVAGWRAAHEEFWNGYLDELRAAPGFEGLTLDDDTRVFVEWFRLERVLTG
jgi:uncharacterized protein YhfF